MTRIIMRIAAALLALLIGTLLISSVSRAEAPGEIDFGADKLEQALPDEAAEILSDNNITPDNGGAAALTFEGTLSQLWELIRGRVVKPLRLLASLMAVVLLCALTESASDTGDNGLKGVFSAVGVLAGAGMAVSAIYGVLSETLTLLSSAAAFMLAFIPIFAGVAAVLGHAGAASAVNLTTLAATQLFSQLSVNFLAPLSGAVMGLSVTGAIHPQLNLSRLGELIKKFVIWGLTLLMTIFMSILSAQTFVANASDNALIRTAKFMVSSGVPIVGGTISDAVNTVHGSLSILKSTIGTYGIAAAAAIIAPTLITVGCYKLVMMCAQAASDIFGLNELSALFKSCDAVMAIIMAVLICFLLLNIIAVVILLTANTSA